MKKYEFVFNGRENIVVQRLMLHVQKPQYFYEDLTIYGKISKKKNHILLYHGGSNRNSFRPVFSAKIIGEGSKTVVSGYWRLPIFAIIFSVIWLGTLLSAFIGMSVSGDILDSILMYPIFMLFALFYIGFVKLCIRSEQKQTEKVIEYIKNQQAIINGKTGE